MTTKVDSSKKQGKRRINRWKILGAAANQKDYQVYAGYLNSDGSHLTTASSSAYARFEKALPFKGCVDFKLFSNFFGDFDSSGTEVACKNNQVHLKDGKLKTTLKLMDFKFPYLYLPQAEGIEITKELIDEIKFLYKFGKKHKDILINKDGLFTTGPWYFCHTNMNLNFDSSNLEYINFKGEFVSVLEEGSKISKNEGISSITYEDGVFSFVENKDKISEEVLERGTSKIQEVKEKGISLGSVAKITQLSKKVNIILANEIEKRLVVEFKKDKILIGAKSFDGETVCEIENPTEIDNISTEIPIQIFNLLSEEFELRVLDDWKLFTHNNRDIICR